VDGPRTLGKYEILDLLGVGGMGTVYRARDRVLQRIVAVKLLHRANGAGVGSEDHGSRFLNEARAVARLNHPNIVSLFEFSDEDPAGAFFAMEYVKGHTVADYLHQAKAPRLSFAIHLIHQLLDGLGYAHENGVIHRDIKPANLLVTNEHRLKIGDFGIAKVGSLQHTSTGLMVGTPAYMAPERYRGDEIDQRCDVYSAAVVFYELLTGHRPFSGELTEIAYRICHGTPRAASSIEPGVPSLLDPVLAKGLAKDPGARYQTAREFAAAVDAVSAALPLVPPASAAHGGITPTVVIPKHVPPSELLPTTEPVSQSTGPPAGWTSEQLADIEQHLTPIMGPMARIVIKRAAALTQDRELLCKDLAASLRSDEERQRFLRNLGGASRTDATTPRKAAAAIGVISPETQDRTTTVLARYIGPIAAVMVRTAARLAVDESDLYQRLTERIADEQERAKCLAELSGRSEC
jgi:serine/threonine-protein kinase